MDQRISIVTLGVKDLSISKGSIPMGSVGSQLSRIKTSFGQAESLHFSLREQFLADFQADPTTPGPAAMAPVYNARTKDEVCIPRPRLS
jgi:hypothetical protein